MKKRITSILLLSFVMVYLVMFVDPSFEVKTESITMQEDLIEPQNTIAFETIQDESNKTKNDFDVAIEEMNHEMAEIGSIEDKEEWFIAYKNIIEKYSYVLDPPESIYDYYSDEELDLLFRVVQAEIGDGYSFEQKCNVTSVIFNRIEDNRFPNSILEVLTPDQFATISNGRYKKVEVSETTILACEYVFMIEDTTNGCLFFDSNNALRYEFVFNDGAHNFYKIKGE